MHRHTTVRIQTSTSIRNLDDLIRATFALKQIEKVYRLSLASPDVKMPRHLRFNYKPFTDISKPAIESLETRTPLGIEFSPVVLWWFVAAVAVVFKFCEKYPQANEGFELIKDQIGERIASTKDWARITFGSDENTREQIGKAFDSLERNLSRFPEEDQKRFWEEVLIAGKRIGPYEEDSIQIHNGSQDDGQAD